MGSSMDQFIRFSTDSFGLERMLRLLQSLAQIIIAVPFLAFNLTAWINRLPTVSSPAEKATPPAAALQAADTLALLGDLRGRLATGRRLFRLFRWVEAFDGAQKAFRASSSSPSGGQGGLPLEAWLDVAARSFNGMYLLLEAATLPDALAVRHLRVFGPSTAGGLAVEAQRFWFLSLACSAASGGLRLLATYAYRAVPAGGDEFGAGVGVAGGGDGEGEKAAEKAREEAREEEKARLAAGLRENTARRRALGRKLVADVLDLSIPGVVVGWVKADPLTVGSAMLVSTLLTGYDFWKRCG